MFGVDAKAVPCKTEPDEFDPNINPFSRGVYEFMATGVLKPTHVDHPMLRCAQTPLKGKIRKFWKMEHKLISNGMDNP